MSTTTHGIQTGDYVRVGKGTKKWYVEAAYESRVTVTRMTHRGSHWTPSGTRQHWVELRRYLDTPAKIATLTKVDQ